MADKKSKSDRKILFEALEPRILLSADILPLEPSQVEVHTEELVIDLEDGESEEPSRFVLEGMEDEDLALEGVEGGNHEVDSNGVEAAEGEGDTARSPEAQLLQQYWLQQQSTSLANAFNNLQSEGAGDIQQSPVEIIVIDAAVEAPVSLLASLESAYQESRHSAQAELESTAESASSLLEGGWNFEGFDFAEGGVVQVEDDVLVLVLNEGEEGISQLDELISQYSNVAALHVFAHGSSGSLRLGSGNLNSENLSRRQSSLEKWRENFSAHADILLYGCNLALGAGEDFVKQLARYTGADVAASDDISGSGGDWQLEFSQGAIEYALAADSSLNNYAYSLAQASVVEESVVEQLENFSDLEDLVLQNINSLANTIEELTALSDTVSGLSLADIGMDTSSLNTFLAALRDPAQLALDFSGNDVSVLAANIESQLNNLVPDELSSLISISGLYDSFAQEIVLDLQWELGLSVADLLSSNGDLTLVDDLNGELANLLDSDLLSTFTSALPGGLSFENSFDADYRGDALFTLSLEMGIDLSAAITSHDIDADLLDVSEDTFIAIKNAEVTLTAGLENVSVNLGADTADTFGINNAEFLISTVFSANFSGLDEQGRITAISANTATFSSDASFNAAIPISLALDGIGNLGQIGVPIISMSGEGLADTSADYALDFQLAEGYRSNLINLLNNLEGNLDFSAIDLSIEDFPFDIDSLALLEPIKAAIAELVDFSRLADSVLPYFNLLDSLIIAGDFLEDDVGGGKSIDYQRAGVADFAAFKTRYEDVLNVLFSGIDWTSLADEDAMWAEVDIATFDLSDYLQANVFGDLLEGLSVIDAGVDASTMGFSELDLRIRSITGAVPTLNGLVEYLQTLLPSFSSATEVGPLSLSGGYDTANKEIRFSVELNFEHILENALSTANQSELQNTINDLLSNIADLDFLSSLGIETSALSDANAQLPQLENIPVFDLAANLNLAFNFGLSLENLIATGSFDADSDAFVELENLYADFSLSTEDLDASFTLIDQGDTTLNLNLLEGTGFSIGGILQGTFNSTESGQRLSVEDLQTLVDADDSRLFNWDVRVPFASELPFSFSGNIAGVDLTAISNLGNPLIRIVDDNLLDNSLDLNIFPDLDIDFILSNDFLNQITGLFSDAQAEANSGLPSFNLPSASELGLPFELSDLQLGGINLGELFDNITNLLDLSVFTDLLQNFSDIYSAIQLIDQMEEEGSDSTFINLADYQSVLEKLLAGSVDFSAEGFSINSLDLDEYRGNINIEAFYREFGSTLTAMFPTRAGSLNELLSNWRNQFGSFPTLKGLGDFISAAIDQMGAVDFDLGPVEFSAVYDGDNSEFRIEISSSIRESLNNMTLGGIAAAVETRISEALTSLGAGGVSGLITEAFDTDSIASSFDPLIDAIASLDFAGAFVFDLSDVFSGELADLGLEDFSFNVGQMDAQLDIDIKNLGFDVDWGSSSVGISDDAYISFPIALSGSFVNPVSIANLGDLFDSTNFNFGISSALDVFLPVDFVFAGFDASNFGTPVLTFSNSDIVGGGTFEFKADLLLSDSLATQVEGVFSDLSTSIQDAANGLDLGDIPALDSLLGGLFNEIDGIAQLGTWAGEYIELGRAFNFSPDLTALGTELGLGLDYDNGNADHQQALVSALNSHFNLTIAVADFSLGDYLPEIFDLLNSDFNLEAYLPTFNLLLGLTATTNTSASEAAAPLGVNTAALAATNFNEIRDRVSSLFRNEGSLNGLVDFLTTLLPSSLSANAGPFSFAVDFSSDNESLSIDLDFSPQVSASLDDALSFFQSAMGSGLSDISELLGLSGNSVNFPDALEDIMLSAGLNLDMRSTLNFASMLDGGGFDAASDVSVEVDEFSAEFSLEGQDLSFSLELGDSNTRTGVSDASIDLSVNASIDPFSTSLGNLIADISGVVNPNLTGEFNLNLPVDLVIAGFDLGSFANPVINVSDSIDVAGGDLFNPLFTLDLALDVREFLLDPINDLVDSIESLGVVSTNLPLLNMSLDELLGVQAYLDNIVSTIENLAPLSATLSYDSDDNVDFSIAQTTLDDVNDVVSSVFGFTDPQTIFNLLKDGPGGVDTLEFDLDLGFAIDQLYTFDLDLWDVLASAGLDMAELGLDVIDISANATLGAEGSADFGLHFDINVSELFEDTAAELIELVPSRNGSATGFELNLETLGIPQLNINAGLDIDRDQLPSGALGDVIDSILGLATIQVKDGYVDLLLDDEVNGGKLSALSFIYDGSNWNGDVALGFDFAAPVYIADSILLTDAVRLSGQLSEDAQGALSGGISIAADALTSLEQELRDSASEILNKVKIALLTSNPLFILEELSNNFDPNVEGSVFDRLLDDFDAQLANLPLPFLGTTGDGADEESAGSTITNAFRDILGALFGDFIGGMAEQIRDAGLEDATLIDLIQEGLYQLLASAEGALIDLLTELGVPPGAGWQLLQVVDADGISNAERYLPVDQAALGEGRIQFEFIMATEFFNLDFAIDFSAGVPGFALQVQDDSNIQFSGDFVLDLGFGFDINARSAADFLFFATDTGEDEKELIVELEASIVDSEGNELSEFDVSAQLGFLQANVGYNTDAVDDFDPARLTGQLVFDLQDFDDAATPDIDESTDNVVSIGDFSSAFTVYVALNANLDGRAILGFGMPTDGSVNFNWDEQYQDLSSSSVIGGGADIHLTVNYYRALVGEPQLENAEGELVPIAELNGTELIFEDIYLDVGFLIGEDSFLYDLIGFVNDYIAGPYEQIEEILFTEVGFLGDIGLVAPNEARVGDQDTTELIDVLKLLADLSQNVPDARVKAAGQAVNAIILLVEVVGNLVDLADTLGESADGYLNFGSFRLGDELSSGDWDDNIVNLGGSPETYDGDDEAITSSSPTTQGGNASERTNIQRPDEGALGAGEDYPTSTNYGSGVEFDFGFDFSIDILENPKSILDIIMGKETDLFSFGFNLEALVGFEVKQNIAGPLLAGLGFDFGLGVDLGIGFSTRGMSDYLGDLFGGNPNPPDGDLLVDAIMEGFYFDDNWGADPYSFEADLGVNSIQGPNDDKPEVFIVAGMEASVGLGLSGLFEASVFGGITGQLGVDLADGNISDGRVYLDELIQSASCFIELEGSLDAELGWSVWVGLETPFFTVTVFEDSDLFYGGRLADFSHSCEFNYPRLASLNNGELLLHTGSNVDERANQQLVPNDTANSPVALGDDETNADYAGYQNYDPNSADFEGSIRDDDVSARYQVYEAIAEEGSNFAVGTEIIVVEAGGFREEYAREAVSSINGDTGSYSDGSGDIIVVNLLDAPPEGMEAIDVNLSGGDGKDQLRVNGGAASVTLSGGGGDDVLIGSDLVGDNIDGGAGNDQIAGFGGDDIIVGDAGNDVIDGGEGADEIWGYLQNQVQASLPSGVDDEDKIRGGAGNDSINAGPGDDNIFWQWGDGSDVEVHGGGDPESEFDTLHLQSYVLSGNGDSQVKSEEGVDNIEFLSTSISSPTTTGNVSLARPGANTSLLSFANIASINLDAGAEADNINVGDLSGSGVRSFTIDNGGDSSFNWDENYNLAGSTRTADTAIDHVSINLGTGNDTLLVSSAEDEIYADSYYYEARWLEENIKFVIKTADADLSDTLSIFGGDGDDSIQATEINTQAMQLTLDGQADNDNIVGSDFSEELIGGVGSDIISGRGGVDVFSDDASTHREEDFDTLYEQRDADFTVSHESVLITNDIDPADEEAVDGRIDINTEAFNVYLNLQDAEYFTEEESITYNAGVNSIFERVHFVGGVEANRFFVNGFGGRLGDAEQELHEELGDYTVYLDGGAEADVYRVWNYDVHPEFSDSSENGEVRLLIDDTGATSVGENDIVVDESQKNDRLIVEGTDERNTFRFDTDFVDAETWGVISRLDDPDDVLANLFGVLDQNEFDTTVRERDASTVTDGQHVYYSDNVETVSIYGSVDEDDLFIADDNVASFYVYGQGGEDRFFIGSVTESGVFPDNKWGMVEYAEELTNGVSYESYFYGGLGDDYFEVNHNAAEIWLYGQENNDTFFIKAHLAKEGSITEQTGNELANISSSEDSEEPLGEEVETNLVFVKNAPVNIIGGGGYDTLAVAGTGIDDTFWVFVDDSGKQRIYGSGLVVDNVQSIERLMLNTGKGDDSIYVYSTLEGQELIISTGENDDLVQFGGPEQTIEFTVPEYVRTETLIEPNYETEERLVLSSQAHFEFRSNGLLSGLPDFDWNLREPLPAEWYTAQALIRGFIFFSLDWQSFYDIQFFADDYNTVNAVSIDGLEAVTYQYTIPEIDRGGILLEQSDLSQINGTVKVDVGPGNDELEINAYGADGELANGSLDRMPVELVDLSEENWLASSLANTAIDGETFVEVNGIAAVDYDILATEVASQLERDNQITHVGLLASMQNNQQGQTRVNMVDGVQINHFGNDEGSLALGEEEIYAEFSAYLEAHGYSSAGPIALENRDARIETYYLYDEGLIDPDEKIYATSIVDFAGEVSHVFIYEPGNGQDPDTFFQSFIGATAQQDFEAWLDSNSYHRNVKAEIYHQLLNGDSVFGSRHYVFTSYENDGSVASIDVYEVVDGAIADAPLQSFAGTSAEDELESYLQSSDLVLDLEGSNTNPDAPPLPILYRTQLEGRVEEVYVVESRTREGDLLYIDMFALEQMSLSIDNSFIRADAELNIQYEYWDAVRGFGSEAGVYFTNMGNDGSDLLQLNLGDADNHVVVNYSAENVTSEINLGAGTDTVEVFGAGGEVVINGDSGINTINIGSDIQSAEDIGLEPKSNPDSTLPDPGYIFYEQATSMVRIEGGSGTDIVNLNDRARGGSSELEVDVVNINRVVQDTVSLPDWLLDQVENRFENIEISSTITRGQAGESYQLSAVEQLRTFQLDAQGNLLGEVSTSAPVEHVFADAEELAALVNDENYWQRQVTENSVTGVLTLTYHELVSITETRNENYISVTGMGANNAHVNIDYDTVEALNIITGEGDDAIRVGATAENMLSQVFSGAGADQIHIYENSDVALEDDEFGLNHSRSLDAIRSPLIIHAGAGENSLIVSDEADLDGDNVRITDEDFSFDVAALLDNDGSVDGQLDLSAHFSYLSSNDSDGNIAIHYAADGGDFGDNLEFRTSAGDDNIRIENIYGNAHTEVYAGAGHDNILVASMEEGFVPGERNPLLSIYGQYGNDIIDASLSPIGISAYGEEGDDSVYGSEFADYLSDEALDNPLNNISGDDLYVGNGGDDVIETRFGADIIFADSGRVLNNAGEELNMRDKDEISQVISENSANAGADRIILGTGDALAFGASGDDEIEIISDAFSRNLVFGDNGQVQINAIGEGRFNLSAANSLDSSVDGDDVFGAEGEGIILFGGFGNDLIGTGTGSDIVFGDNGSIRFRDNEVAEITSSEVTAGGDDIISTGGGDDIALGGLGEDVILAGAGSDALIGDLGVVSIDNGKIFQVGTTQEYVGENDILSGGEGEDVLLGGEGNDELLGSFQQDTMLGYFGRVTFGLNSLGENEVRYMVRLGQGFQDLVGLAYASLYTIDPGFTAANATETVTPERSYSLNYSASGSALFANSDFWKIGKQEILPTMVSTSSGGETPSFVQWVGEQVLPEGFILDVENLLKAYEELLQTLKIEGQNFIKAQTGSHETPDGERKPENLDDGEQIESEAIPLELEQNKPEVDSETKHQDNKPQQNKQLGEESPWKLSSLSFVAASLAKSGLSHKQMMREVDEKSRKRRIVKWGS